MPPERVVDPDGRDPERSPMPLDGERRARGFSADGVEPWLPLGDLAVNVAAQEADPRSMLALHRALLALRRSRDDLADGRLRDAARRPACSPTAAAARRSSRSTSPTSRATAALPARVLLDTGLARAGERVEGSSLAPGEGVILDA